MFETLGRCLWQTVHMSMQNGSHLKIWRKGILIHTLELTLWHLEVFPYVCAGKPCLCNIFCPRAMWGACMATHAHKRDNLYPLWLKLKFSLPACIVWLYYASSSTMWPFLDNFFLLSVSTSCYTLSRKLHTKSIENYILRRKKQTIYIIK